MEVLIGILVGLVVALVGVLALRRRNASDGKSTQILSSIEEMRSVGELSVYKVFTKEIVTSSQHAFGDVGKKFFQWVVSTNKMAMIFSFEIDFRYNLQSPEFRITEQSEGVYHLRMPKCFYETYIKDIQIYDEKKATVMPWLLPGVLHGVFGPGFNEEDKNNLIDAAKQHASVQAKALVDRMSSEVHGSARQTLEALARGFGASRVTFDFQDAELVESKIEYDSSQGEAA
ncbi:MAG: hypothetical protein ACI9OU_000364 [Candidatus Promineifilaceae bacterium]|jgi:hypothetical protein